MAEKPQNSDDDLDLLTRDDLVRIVADVGFWASELKSVLRDMEEAGLESFYPESMRTIRDGFKRASPGINKMRRSLYLAISDRGTAGEPEENPDIDITEFNRAASSHKSKTAAQDAKNTARSRKKGGE